MNPTTTLSYSTKTRAVTTHLTELARRLGPGARLPTMKELSIELGVSIMTLNRALSELEAQGMVLRRQGSGTYVAAAAGQTGIGVIYDRDVFAPGASPFPSMLLHELGARLGQGDNQISLFLTRNQNGSTAGQHGQATDTGTAAENHGVAPLPADLSDALERRRLVGLLFVGESQPAVLQQLVATGLPLVALSYAPIARHRVRLDHAATAAIGARELARQGCRRIGLWIPAGVGLGPAPGRHSFEELEAFAGALKEAGRPYNPDWVWGLESLSSEIPPEPLQNNHRQGYAAACQLFGAKAGSQPDGLVILDDMMARGALVALNELGIPLGTKLRLASHTNRGSQVLFGYQQTMTLLEFDPGEVAAALLNTLHSLMAGRRTPALVQVEPRISGNRT